MKDRSESVRSQLQAKLSELRSEREQLEGSVAGPSLLVGYGKRAGDHVAETADRLARSRTSGELELLEEEVLTALARLDAGSYGICQGCGTEIPRERLEALPWAVLCVGCKQRERGTGRSRQAG